MLLVLPIHPWDGPLWDDARVSQTRPAALEYAAELVCEYTEFWEEPVCDHSDDPDYESVLKRYNELAGQSDKDAIIHLKILDTLD